MTLCTGRVLHHDPRSRLFAAPRATLHPASVLHRLDAAALDQNGLGACVGFAAAQWLNCAKARRGRARFNNFAEAMTGIHDRKTYDYVDDIDGRWLYMEATQHDPFDWTYPPTDGGSSGLGVAKALQKFGAIERYEWTFSFDQFLAHAQHQPVLVGTLWLDSMFDPDNKGIIRALGDYNPNVGHEYLIHGINWPRKLIRIRNSWGPDWGLKGDAYIPFNDMDFLLRMQGDVIVPIVGTTMTPQASVVNSL